MKTAQQIVDDMTIETARQVHELLAVMFGNINRYYRPEPPPMPTWETPCNPVPPYVITC
jgi:hypothetical protein